MSEKEEKREEPILYVREWKLIPGKWRPATPEELRELKETRKMLEVRSPLIDDIEDAFRRFRRFERKLEEAFQELFGK